MTNQIIHYATSTSRVANVTSSCHGIHWSQSLRSFISVSIEHQHWTCPAASTHGHAAHSLTSCRYAWECQTQEGGWGLDGTLREHSWKLRGIVNGIDYSEWSPSIDLNLRSDGYRNYDTSSMQEGKAACKKALQRVSASMAGSARLSLLQLCFVAQEKTYQPLSLAGVALQSHHVFLAVSKRNGSVLTC